MLDLMVLDYPVFLVNHLDLVFLVDLMDLVYLVVLQQVMQQL